MSLSFMSPVLSPVICVRHLLICNCTLKLSHYYVIVNRVADYEYEISGNNQAESARIVLWDRWNALFSSRLVGLTL